MSQKAANKVDAKSKHELPEPRQGKALRKDVTLPLQNTPLSNVVYFLAAGVLLYLAYYSYLIVQWCVSSEKLNIVVIELHSFSLLLNVCRKNDAGGWVNLSLGRDPTSSSNPLSSASDKVPFGAGTKFEHKEGTSGDLLESRLNELAEQLGIQPTDLASAVKPLIPTPRAAALENDPEATGTLASVLGEDVRSASAAHVKATAAAGGILDTMVGLDEPPTEVS
jgi:hypothetical protein